MWNWKESVLAAVVGVISLAFLIVVLLSLTHLNFVRPWLEERVSAATGRAFEIKGDLLLDWRAPEGYRNGWRQFVPWPHLRAHRVALGNADWSGTDERMLAVQQLDFSINPLRLLQRTVSVPTLILTDAWLVLEIGPEGAKNWVFPQPQDPSRWTLDVDDLSLNNANVRFFDPAREADVLIALRSEQDGTLNWTVKGSFAKDPVQGDGQAGAPRFLRESDRPYPVTARLQVGESEMRVQGTLTNPRDPSEIDVRLKLSGASMGHLFPLTGIVLPATPKFSTEGRLVGSMKEDDFHLRYENFSGRAGSSDLGGTLEYLRREPRPVLRGKVVSEHLHLADLRALLGVEDKENGGKGQSSAAERGGQLLPEASFRSERWDAIDADVEFAAKEIMRQDVQPFEDLFTRIQLSDGRLRLDPLRFGLAGGVFDTFLRIDGRADPAKGRFRIRARGLQLDQLFPQVEKMDASLGQLQINADLSGIGNSFSALAASADGEARAFVSEGTISKAILETMGLNIGSLIVTRIFGDHQVRLHCLAADFAVRDGLMQAQTFIVDTADAIIGVEGSIDLGRERMNLTIHPESKGVRLLSLRAPLYVRGTLANPDLSVDTGVVGAKAGLAAVLGLAASPIAALAALINPGPGEESPCPTLLKRAKQETDTKPDAAR